MKGGKGSPGTYFVQVDNLLVPSSAYRFTSTHLSYSVQSTALAQLIRCLSRSLSTHELSLVPPHTTYHSRPHVDTADVNAFMAFSGWDLNAWQATTFATEDET
ncbi:hypothetical protein Q5752_006036 [Cryptotrichosporon argae]